MKTIIVGPHIKNIDIVKEFEYIIGVESGASYLISKGIEVDLAIGDFDAVTSEEMLTIINKSRRVIKFESNKIFSDLEGVFKELVNYDFVDVTVCGVLDGNRLDHLFANLILLRKYSNMNITLINDNNRIALLKPGEYTIKKNGYKYISFFTLEPSDINLCSGFVYPYNGPIDVNTTSLISNEFIEDEASFVLRGGLVYLFQTND